jgi:AcrR family transcriptional regulator
VTTPPPPPPPPISPPPPASARRGELLELAYAQVLEHGLGQLSLRPLAAAIGSSPRVLLFLFGSKDGLVRALLARARAEEIAIVAQVRAGGGERGGLAEVAALVWRWLAAPERRGLLRLWVESYGRSLVEPDGPWGRFAPKTVED